MKRDLLSLIIVVLFVSQGAFAQDSLHTRTIGATAMDGSPDHLLVHGDRAFVGCIHMGLYVINVADSTRPAVDTLLFTGWRPICTAAAGHFAYVVELWSGLRVVSMADPEAPIQTSMLTDVAFAEAVVMLDHYALMVAGNTGLLLVDVADSTAPVIVDTLALSGYAEDIALDGTTAYVVSHNTSQQWLLDVVDVSSPTNLVHLSVCNLPAYPKAMAAADGFVFLAMDTLGVAVVDVRDPMNPTLIDTIETPGTAHDVAAGAGILLVADGFTGLRVIDISDITTPREIGYYDPAGSQSVMTVAMNVESHLAYVGGAGLLRIVDYADAQEIDERPRNTMPTEFGNLDNFPNPFNATTTISFSLAKASKVKLAVFDVAGRNVRTLVDEIQLGGEHSIVFDGREPASGIYFARAEAGGMVRVQKMVLLK